LVLSVSWIQLQHRTGNYCQSSFTANDVVNLIARVGLQVGIGEGRPDSKESAGLGYGLFEVV
jgi:hypothetical protein